LDWFGLGKKLKSLCHIVHLNLNDLWCVNYNNGVYPPLYLQHTHTHYIVKYYVQGKFGFISSKKNSNLLCEIWSSSKYLYYINIRFKLIRNLTYHSQTNIKLKPNKKVKFRATSIYKFIWCVSFICLL
jgi:hypothetical protein